jgi:UDP-N-acetylglucosamine--N-acetylmuramyl-(pentapeptide) pyrophosphoryl-undecaprenol N-acetylglucosamine transferase
VVIFGGSQGALHLDQAAVGACRLLRHRADLQVVLLTGPAHLDLVRRAVADQDGSLVVRVLGFLDRMELAYAAADLVVARAGATTVAEITVCGLPAVLVPYPYATARHQDANAAALHRSGAATVVPDERLSAEGLAARIEGLVDHRERLAFMAGRSRAMGRPHAAKTLADVVTAAA